MNKELAGELVMVLRTRIGNKVNIKDFTEFLEDKFGGFTHIYHREGGTYYRLFIFEELALYVKFVRNNELAEVYSADKGFVLAFINRVKELENMEEEEQEMEAVAAAHDIVY